MIDYKQIYEGMSELEKIQHQYAYKILSEEIISCKWVRLACERSFEDYSKQKTNEFPYYYDSSVGEKFEKLCSKLSHIEGPKAGQPVVLDEWQVWLFSQLLGWKNNNGDNKGYRRFRTFHLEVARGNGKSFVSSILALWGLACDGEGGPQIYSAATDRRQASIVFNGTKRQITNPNHDRLMKYLDLQALNKEIRCGQNGGTYSALSRDASRMDGLNIHFAIVDEIHAHPNSNTWDVLVSGSTKRRQSLMVAITTAGHDLSSFGYVQNEYCRAILEGQGDTRDETFLGVIFCAEEGDDPYSEDAWRKANPCWDSAIDKIKFRSNALKAKAVVSARNEFYTKHLNMWINSGGSWIDGNSLQNCYDPHINENDTYDYKLCGFDLATVNDLCCYVNVFIKIIDGKNHYYIFPHAFIPQRAIDQNFNAKYPIWQSTGELTVMPGEAIDHKEFDRLLIENIKTHEIGIIGGDRFMGVPTLQAISEAGFNAYAVKQTTVGMCLGTEEFETAILEGRLHWNNEVFQWNTMNAILEFDRQGMFKPIKEHPKSNKKIDTVHAAISAIICGMDNDFGSSNIAIYN